MRDSLEPRLDAAVPEFMTELRASEEWGWVDDEDSRVFTILEGLRLYLLDHRRDRDLHARAWAAIEELAPTDDALLLNGLAVGLLEGHWPRRDAAMMGPRTRALWDEMRPPPRRGLLRRRQTYVLPRALRDAGARLSSRTRHTRP